MTDRRKNKEQPRKDQEPAPSEGSSRRGFFWTLGLTLGGLALLEYVAVAADFLRPRKRRVRDEGSTIVRAGPVGQFEFGSVTAFPQAKFYLARLESGGFLALSRECTHLGCTVPWIADERRFVCPCHSSAYDINGDVLSPPAPRPLDLYAVRIENGIVKVDISRALRREKFELAQITRQ